MVGLWCKGCYEGGVLGVYFYKKNFFSFISFCTYVFFMSPFGEKLPAKKKKKSLIWTLDPKENKAHNLEKQDAS